MQSKLRSKRSDLLKQSSLNCKNLNLSLNEINPSQSKQSSKHQDDLLENSKFTKKFKKSLKLSPIVHLDSESMEPASSALSAVPQITDCPNGKKSAVGNNLKQIVKAPKRERKSKNKPSQEGKLVKNVKCEKEKMSDIGQQQQTQGNEYFTKQLANHYIFRNVEGVFLMDQQLAFSVIFEHNQTPTLKKVTCRKQDLQWLQEIDKQEYILPFFLRMLQPSRSGQNRL